MPYHTLQCFGKGCIPKITKLRYEKSKIMFHYEKDKTKNKKNKNDISERGDSFY